MKKQVTNWGNYPRIESDVEEFVQADELKDKLAESNGLITRGMGKCYGDAALSHNIISTQQFDKIIELNETEAWIHCQSGVSLADILDLIVPKGFFLPVTPGTKFISVGGAIAADIHGKNHHKEGSFSNHLEFFTLLTASGETFTCSKTENADLFWATCGGMGLTGVILEAKFSLKRIETAFIKQERIVCKNLKEMMEAFEATSDGTYSMSWIDCFAKGKEMGKGIILNGEHATVDELPNKLKAKPLELPNKLKLGIPFYLPPFILNQLSIKAFNFLLYRLQKAKPGTEIVDYDSYFYPLDSINNWNRMYGRRGFTQYQCVFPKETSYQGLSEVLEIASKSSHGSFLAVLKMFGVQEQNYLGFPCSGYTLALDFPVNKKVFAMLEKFDEVVAKYGGRVYLAKDVRVKPKTFKVMYSNKPEFAKVLEKYNPQEKFSSLLSQRVGITSMKTALILGANSGIAKAISKEFAADGFNLILAARDTAKLEEEVSALKGQYGIEVEAKAFDGADSDSHKEFYNSLPAKPEVVILCFGYLPDQETAQNDFTEVKKTIDVNYTGAVSILELAAADMESRKTGTIIGISSVAGDRGRKKNYFYGSAKAGLTAYLSGLRQRLVHSGVNVLTVVPGFVYTKMTEGMDLPPNLTSKPEEVAKVVHKAYKKKKNVVYSTLKWALIMFIIRHVPEGIFKKMKF